MNISTRETAKNAHFSSNLSTVNSLINKLIKFHSNPSDAQWTLHLWHLKLITNYSNRYLGINPFRQIICCDDKVILCEMLQCTVHFSLSDGGIFGFVSRKWCEYRWIQYKNSGIYRILIYLLFFVLGEIKHFFISHQTAETAAWLFKHSHTNSQKQMSSEWTKFSRAHHGTNTTIYITNRYAYRCTQPVAIRHSDMVVVQGKTEESCDRVSDNVQCLLLHSFSITRQYAHSTLAAANSFSLADLDLRAGLPISSLFCGFLE